MNSAKKLGLVGRIVGSLALLASINGCAYFPADGIHSTGGPLNPCSEECRLNAEFLETLRHMTPYETILAHKTDKDGNGGIMPSYSCPRCYPSMIYTSKDKK